MHFTPMSRSALAKCRSVQRKLLVAELVLLLLLSGGLVALAQSGEPGAVYLPVVSAQGQDEPSPEAQQAIDLLAAQEEVAAYLANHPGWVGEAWPEEESSVWYVDFYDGATEEWLGGGSVDLASQEILGISIPRELTPEEIQAGKAEIEAFLAADAAIQARLGSYPRLWEHEISYDPWEQRWEAWYYHGLDAFTVLLYFEEDGRIYLDNIVDPYVLEEAAAEQLRRDQAVELAYEAEGIDDALAGVDNWRTYVEHQGEGRWTVEFVADGQLLFSALVDIDAWNVMEVGP